MAAFRYSSETKPQAFSATLLQPRPSSEVGKLTTATNKLVQAAWSDIQVQCPSAEKLKTLLVYFASFFHLNEVEVAAWDCYLLRLLREGHSLSQQIAHLRMSAYYAKSTLGHQMQEFEAKLIEEDSNFTTDYVDWLMRSERSLKVTFHEIHQKYAKLSGTAGNWRRSKNTNDVVDDIVQAVVTVKTSVHDTKHTEEAPRKYRKFEPESLDLEETPFLPAIPVAFELDFQDKMFGELEELVFDVGRYLSDV